MTDLIAVQSNLPTTLEDLSKFALIGRDKLQAVRAEISALKNLNLAKEVREQKLREGQEIGKLVLMAEARLGEIFNQMPKDKGGRPLKNSSPREEEFSESPKPKLEVAADMGFNKNQVAQFQKLADNPDDDRRGIRKSFCARTRYRAPLIFRKKCQKWQSFIKRKFSFLEKGFRH